MTEAAAAASFLDGLRLAFLFVLLGLAARMILATTAFVLSRRAAHQDIVLILCVVAMIAASALLTQRLLSGNPELSSVLRLTVCLAAPVMIVATIAVSTLTETGRIWQALLVSAGTLWQIGCDAEAAAGRALLASVPLIVGAGLTLLGEPTPPLAVWGVLSASLLLLMSSGVILMTSLLFALGAVYGVGTELLGDRGGLLIAIAATLALAGYRQTMSPDNVGARTL